MRRYSSGQREQTVNLLASAFVGSNPTRRTRQKIPTAWDFFVRVRDGDMFLSTKTVESGSWKFQFDETEIIPDHKFYFFDLQIWAC